MVGVGSQLARAYSDQVVNIKRLLRSHMLTCRLIEGGRLNSVSFLSNSSAAPECSSSSWLLHSDRNVSSEIDPELRNSCLWLAEGGPAESSLGI